MDNNIKIFVQNYGHKMYRHNSQSDFVQIFVYLK